MVENPVKLRNAKKLTSPQCPECGYWNVRVMRKAREDFYGIPIVWHCPDCGWEKEILMDDILEGMA